MRSLSLQTRKITPIYIILTFILCIQVIQFRRTQKDIISHVKDEPSVSIAGSTYGSGSAAVVGENIGQLEDSTSAAPEQQAQAISTTSEPSYEPTYVPTAETEDVDDAVIWEAQGDMQGHEYHGLLLDQKCHVIENVCRRNADQSNYLFYFQDKEDNGFEPKYSISRPRQPILNYGHGTRTRIQMNTESLHQNFTWIKAQQCVISPIKNHVILNGGFIQMMGEYVQRIIMPLHHILEDYASLSKSKTKRDIIKEIQFYINFHENEKTQKVLPSHHLYMDGLPYGQDLESWSETLDPTYTMSSPPCHCYTRMIFCGYQATDKKTQMMEIEGESRNVTTIQLTPGSLIPRDTAKHCAHYMAPAESLENEDCKVWQDLRTTLLRTYHIKNPNLSQNIDAYRIKLIQEAHGHDGIQINFDTYPLHDWKIIGLSQRKISRIWLNIDKVMEYCNKHYFDRQIACVQVDVEDLPTNFVSVGNNQVLSAVTEQVVLYQSINGLIGIHGSQLTQGILMPQGSVMVELLPWFPKDWGFKVWGDGWTNQKNHPTPMGIMWHNTDIHEAGWYLTRDSVPLCQNITDSEELHNYSVTDSPDYFNGTKGGNTTITELEYCLAVTYGNQFRWDLRNFNVPWVFFDQFVDTFFPLRARNVTSVSLECSEWRERGEKNGFVLYNLVCNENGAPKPHHYYHNPS